MKTHEAEALIIVATLGCITLAAVFATPWALILLFFLETESRCKCETCEEN